MAPKLVTNLNSANGLDRIAEIFKGVDWVVPAYISLGKLSMLGGIIERAPLLQKQAALEMALRSIYDERHFASFLLGLYDRTPYVCDFRVQISEAIEAWHLGLHHAAVATMVRCWRELSDGSRGTGSARSEMAPRKSSGNSTS
jgi:hypothetical protein